MYLLQDMLRASARLRECPGGGRGAARGASTLKEALEPGDQSQCETEWGARSKAESAEEGSKKNCGAESKPWQPPWGAGGSTLAGGAGKGVGSWVRRVKLHSPAVWGRCAGFAGGMSASISRLQAPACDNHAGFQSASLMTGPQTRPEEGLQAGRVPIAMASGRSDKASRSLEGQEGGWAPEEESPPWDQETKGMGLARLYQEAVEAEGTPGGQAAWREVVGACTRVANWMCELNGRGRNREALMLFEPEILAKVRGSSMKDCEPLCHPYGCALSVQELL